MIRSRLTRLRVRATRRARAAIQSHVPFLRADAESQLEAHSRRFARRVLTPADGVHVAIGYGLANSIMIEGDDGVIVVDALESDAAAREVREAFRAINPSPIRALIYTHNHTDHIFGAHGMVGDDAPEIYAHASFREHVVRIGGLLRPAIFTRSMRQFGTYLGDDERINAGIGPSLDVNAKTSPATLWPTHAVEERLEATLAGVRVVMGHTPGETPDHLHVWLPDRGVLIPGDNFYHAFPNLYAIRGTAYRDVMTWVASLDTLDALGASTIVPCHTEPIVGAAKVRDALRSYRDAIQYVHDQTLRGINQGLTPDALAETIELPASLQKKPFLKPLYGRVDWSVRAIYAGYLGWFDGDAAHLHPLPPRERAARMITLAGSAERLRDRARDALEGDDPRWSVELSGHLLALDPDDTAAATLRAAALRAIARGETSAAGRNYLLTQAREAEGSLETPRSDISVTARRMVEDFPLDAVMRSLAINLDGPAAAKLDTAIELHFVDIDQLWTLHVRRGVAVTHEGPPAKADVTLSCTVKVWKEMLIGVRNPATTLLGPHVKLRGRRLALIRAMRCFRPA